MATQDLKSHYERKYISTGSNTAPLCEIKRTATPIDRFEAAVTFVPRIFRGGDVLELGAGDGRVANALLQCEPRITTYTLSDLVVDRLAEVRSRLDDPRVRIAAIDAESMPAEGTQYNLIIMIALIEHLVDPLRAMRNLRRLLKPRGMVYIDTPNLAKFTRRTKLLLGRFPSTAARNEGLTTYEGGPVDLYDEGHLHYFTFRSLEKLLTQFCGYSRVEEIGYPAMNPFVVNKHVHGWLAARWPRMFSEICLVAHA